MEKTAHGYVLFSYLFHFLFFRGGGGGAEVRGLNWLLAWRKQRKRSVRFQSLFVCISYILSPMDTKITNGCLNFRVAKFKGLRYSRQM